MAEPYLGIWLDHREAYLIWATEDGEARLQHTTADYPEQGQRADQSISAGSGAYGGVPPHANLEEKQRREAHRFHEKLFRAIRRAENVYIFGPGLAKKELVKTLRAHKGFNGQVQGVESAEKMSDAQMAARVREFFGLPKVPGVQPS